MASIIRGTTPTIEYVFSCVDVSDIVTSYLTIKQKGVLLIEKTLADAEVEEKSLLYTLTQEETLSLEIGKVYIMHNFVLNDGTRGASEELEVTITRNHKNEVI